MISSENLPLWPLNSGEDKTSTFPCTEYLHLEMVILQAQSIGFPYEPGPF